MTEPGDLEARLHAIRRSLDRLARADSTRCTFGAGSHGYRERPTFTEGQLARLEADLGVTLPEELRLFLQKVHGGGPGPGYGLDVSGNPHASRPFPYGNSEAEGLIARRRTERYEMLPFAETHDDDEDWPPGPGFIWLAHQGCGCFDVLVVTGEQRGCVWGNDSGWWAYAAATGQWRFLDWYEAWLTRSLTALGAA
jgi:hypothetical protein